MSAEGSRCILVVDVDEGLLRELSEGLGRHGFVVLTADRGAKALDILESRRGADVRVVLIDLMMPDIQGVELAIRIGFLRSNLKILIMSRYADGIVVPDTFSGHNVDFVSKPFNLSELCLRLEMLLS